MARPKELPEDLIAGPFATRTAHERGVSAGRLRAKDLVHPFHGVNARGEPVGIIERCHAYTERMRDGQAFSHVTAAVIYGLPLPSARADDLLHVSTLFPRSPPRAQGVRGHTLRRIDVREVGGLPVCAPVQVWMQVGAELSREDLVAAGDHLVGGRARSPLATLDELRAAVASSPRGTPGLAALRWAIDRVRLGSDSRPESLLRVALVEAGLPEPAVNPPVVLTGGRVVHPDLVFARRRVILEYEGDGHRTDAAQWIRDIRRHDDMLEAGWRVIRVTRRDLFVDRPAFIRRIGALLDPNASERRRGGRYNRMATERTHQKMP